MKPFFVVLLTLFAIYIGQASAQSKINCVWEAAKNSNNFDAEDHLHSFAACSLFIRGQLLGSQSGWMGDLGAIMFEKDSVGTLTYSEDDGSKRICQTKLKKANPDFLSQPEALGAYLKAEIDGGALDSAGKIKAQDMLRKLGLDLKALMNKIDSSIVLECFDQVS